MSELTTPIRIDIPGVGSIESADLYLKYEADKVIARNKYKRCLAMADYCYQKAEYYDACRGLIKAENQDDFWKEKLKKLWDKICLFHAWNERWLALADKFKETK